MTSYKNLYLEMKEKYEKQIESLRAESETDFLCPLCNSVVMESISEIFCSNENCKYDLTMCDLIEKLNLNRK